MDYLLRMGKHPYPLMIMLDKDEVLIGNGNFPEMRQSAHVSRQHASFRITSDGEWLVTDLQSLYGVYVNGTRIKQTTHCLKIGDSIGLGVIHATSNEDFEFSLCRVKKEPDDDLDVIFQDGIETMDAGSCNISQGFCQQESCLIDNLSVNDIQSAKETEGLNSYKHRYSHIINGPQPIVVLTRCDKLLQCPKKTVSTKRTRKRRKKNTTLARKRRKLLVDERSLCQQENDVLNNLSANDFQSKEEIDDLNSYKHRYAHIINGPQPIVLLTRCDEMLPCPKNTSSTKRLLKKTKKKRKYRIDKKNALHNMFPSNENSNLIFESGHSLKDAPTEEHESDITIHNEFSNMKSNSCFLCSASSNDFVLYSQLVKSGKKLSSKNLHLVNRDNELESSFKAQINARPTSCGEETNDGGNFPCEGSNSVTEQPFVLHRIKAENALHNSETTNFEKPLASSIAMKIKTEVPEIDIRVDSNMEENSGNEVFVYSQMDEVITISDDEDYLNFFPSQEKNAETMLNIKVEPTDYDDADFENHMEERVEQLVEPTNCNEDSDSNYKGSKSDVESEDEQCSENIDAIKLFLQRNSTSRENIRKPTTNNAIQSKIKEKAVNKMERENSYFPVLSKKHYPQEKLSTDEFQRNLPACENGKLETNYSRISDKKHATITLIEPQPMKNHPRYQQRSKEWFDDGNYEKSDKGCKVKQSNKASKNVKKTQIELKSRMSSKNSMKKKKLIKGKVEKQMAHLNSGSEIQPVTTESQILANETESASPAHIPMEKQNSVPSNEVSTKLSGVIKDKIAREDASEINGSLKSLTEFLTRTSIRKKQISKSPPNSGKTCKIPKLNSNSKDSSLLTSTEMIQAPKIGNIRNGLNSVDKQNFPQAVETKVIKQAGTYEGDKPSNSKLLLPNIAHDTMDFRRIGFANTQETSTNETDIQTTYNPATGHDLVTNYNVQLRDPRLQNHRNIPPPAQQFCVAKPRCIQKEPLSADAKEVIKKLIRLDFDSVLSVVLHWSPIWLKEYKYVGKPPPCITKDLKSLPSSYNSSNEYIASFYPMILLELWEYVLKEYEQMESAAKDKHEVNAIGMIITECISKGDIMVLNCESVVSSNSAFYPREGNLVIVDLKEANDKQGIRKIFGYVFNHKVEKLDSCHLHREFYRRPEAKSSNSLLYKFSLKTKRLKLQPALETLTKACVLCYVANKVRLAEGLQYLLTSPLKHDILHPSEKTVKCQHRNAELPKSVFGHYNQRQTSVIVDVSEEIKAEYFKPKLILLQGPPGTGKTHTITGVIQNLIANENVKILITAPSNAAVDEIGKRLIELRKSHNLKNMKVVRIGQHERIHKDLLPYALENITRTNIIKNTKSKLEHSKRKLREMDEVIQLLKKEIICKSMTEPLTIEVGDMKNKLRMHIQRKQALIEEIERKEKESVAFNNAEIYANKVIVLEKANVVLSTLGSCRLKILEKVFGEKSGTHFTCCIVDEAAQCTEPEVMQLLAFGLSKFVLIGDHQQLPATVYSKLAVQMNYNVSFFQRILAHFQKQNLSSPIRMLTEQYRMHSEICSFPSLHFYSNKLYTPAGLDEQLNFPLKPLVILNISESQESNVLSSKKNSPEAEIIFHTCEELRRLCNFNKYSIGIITPYQGQKNLILSYFKGNLNYDQIEVNTIDSFQGREKDIIILSCVRARSHDGNIGFLECSQRLNVAITRARHCLIICGHMNSLNNHPDWRALINHSMQREVYITVPSSKDIPVVIKGMKRQT